MREKKKDGNTRSRRGKRRGEEEWKREKEKKKREDKKREKGRRRMGEGKGKKENGKKRRGKRNRRVEKKGRRRTEEGEGKEEEEEQKCAGEAKSKLKYHSCNNQRQSRKNESLNAEPQGRNRRETRLLSHSVQPQKMTTFWKSTDLRSRPGPDPCPWLASSLRLKGRPSERLGPVSRCRRWAAVQKKSWTRRRRGGRRARKKDVYKNSPGGGLRRPGLPPKNPLPKTPPRGQRPEAASPRGPPFLPA